MRTHLSLKQHPPVSKFSTASGEVNKFIPFQSCKSLGHGFIQDPFYLHIEAASWVSWQGHSKSLWPGSSELWHIPLSLVVVYSYKQKHLHFYPVYLSNIEGVSFFWEELVARKYCAQAVGSCSRISHNLERLGRKGGLWGLCVILISQKRDEVTLQSKS